MTTAPSPEDGAEMLVPEELRRFPAGLRALEGMEDDDLVVLINLQLGKYRKTITDYDAKPLQKGGRPMKELVIGKFTALPPIRVHQARRIFENQMKRGRIPKVVVAPLVVGNCKNAMIFTEKATGVQYRTCPFRKCPHHPMPAGITWSIWQAQHFCRMKERAHVIQEFIAKIDRRYEVIAWGNAAAMERTMAHQRKMGMTGQQLAAAVH